MIGWMMLLERFDAWDKRAFDRVARSDLPVLDALLPHLSSAADNSVLWGLVAGVLMMTGRPRLQRAGVRGLLAISLASPLTSMVVKQAIRRPRPLTDLIPVIRRRRVPASSSLPSGHSASAVAFAVAVARDAPLPVATSVTLLAAGVAASRVYVGAHYPGDVLAGVAVGAAAGWSARGCGRWLRRTLAACAAPREIRRGRCWPGRSGSSAAAAGS
ncbi:phosphatase PAP2 family protein [Nonomuraea sp. NPDC048881]|uniref:phosphatase PAP2 family protein n=1 Tax=Nonomuraea sp. NPDC048881 TaxID=3155030 RepID=UPI0033F140B0